MLRKPLLLF
jgi:hypothetical protein